tara:strand:- start:190 stop:522 length:333 start_codon:yes stop_codon:yes gene_type:complete
MVLTLILLTILSFYFIYLIKKINKNIDDISNLINSQLDENKLYLLDELNRIKEESNNLIISELHKLEKYNIKQINRKHEQLVSGEIQKLRSDLNKDLNDIVESVKNIKVF